ncbi:hypothetical protein ACROYT_G031951 [Oculina patagonica]
MVLATYLTSQRKPNREELSAGKISNVNFLLLVDFSGDLKTLEGHSSLQYTHAYSAVQIEIISSETLTRPHILMIRVGNDCQKRDLYCDKKMMYLGIFVFAACTTFGLVQSEKGKPFFCPICFTWGENADSDCEAHTQNKPCYEADPVCVLVVKSANPAEYMEREIMRFCMDKTFYNQKNWLHDCETYRDCNKVMCETSGCKA